MQWKWNAWLHTPHATLQSSVEADELLAWHSMQRSMMWLRQMAQLSTIRSHDHSDTAFHRFTSNSGPDGEEEDGRKASSFPLEDEEDEGAAVRATGEEVEASSPPMATSVMAGR